MTSGPVYTTYPEYDTGFVAPLTTTFVPPASCLQNLYDNGGAFIPVLGAITDSQCYPPNFSSAAARTPWKIFCGYYSPGVCPGGYTIACTENSSFLAPSETGYVCCPSNYQCLGADIVRMCTSTIVDETVVTVETAMITTNASSFLATTTSLISSEELPTAAWASPIRIRWRNADLSIVHEPVTAKPSPGSPPTTSVPMNTAESTADGRTAVTNGLPIGTKVTIGVAVPVVVMAVIALVMLLFWRRRKRAGAPTAPALDARDNTESGLDRQHVFPAGREADSGKNNITVEIRPNLTFMGFNGTSESSRNQHHPGSSYKSSEAGDKEPQSRRRPQVNTQVPPSETGGTSTATTYLATSPVKRKPLPSTDAAFGKDEGIELQFE